MRIAVLSSPSSWYCKDLARAGEGRHEILPMAFSRLCCSMEGRRGRLLCDGVDLAECDAVIVRSMPPGTLEQVVFRMDVLGRLSRQGTLVVNSPRSLEAAIDKCLATAKLNAAGLLSPRTFVCQTEEDAMGAFHSLGGRVVVKPVFGGEGRGIMRVEDEALAQRSFKTLEQLGAVIYLQEFIEHPGYDLRLLVIGRRVLAMRRRSDDWRTNVSRGAVAEPVDCDANLVETARRAARAVGASMAGVDVLPGLDGRRYVLEVNAVPGWKALAASLDIDVGKLVLEEIERLNHAGA